MSTKSPYLNHFMNLNLDLFLHLKSSEEKRREQIEIAFIWHPEFPYIEIVMQLKQIHKFS